MWKRTIKMELGWTCFVAYKNAILGNVSLLCVQNDQCVLPTLWLQAVFVIRDKLLRAPEPADCYVVLVYLTAKNTRFMQNRILVFQFCGEL